MKANNQVAYAALLLRLFLGTMLIAHGLLKVLVFTLPGTVQFFASVGYPGWLAYPAVAMELGGGVLMLGGVATRWVALAFVPEMLGVITVHWGNGWAFNSVNGGWEYPALLAVLMLVQALLGPGAYAMGSLGSRKAGLAHA